MILSCIVDLTASGCSKISLSIKCSKSPFELLSDDKLLFFVSLLILFLSLSYIFTSSAVTVARSPSSKYTNLFVCLITACASDAI